MALPATARPRFPAQSYHLGDNAGRRSNVFQPPLTPATTSFPVPYNASSVECGRPTPNRKRSRGSSPGFAVSTPNLTRYNECYFSATSNTSQAEGRAPASFEHEYSSGVGSATSPLPLVNDRYNIAGGLDTPTGLAAARHESDWPANEDNFRRQWGPNVDIKRRHDSSPNGASSQTWGQFMFEIINGSLSMAGKMIQFARKGAFQGFHAGGGQGYMLDMQQQNAIYDKMQQSGWEDADPAMIPPTPFQLVPSPTPRQHTPEEYLQDRGAKRKKGDGTGWIMVEKPSPYQEATSHCDTSRSPAVTPSFAYKRQSLIPRPSASRASSRNSLAPTMVARHHTSTATHAGSPAALNNDRLASTASPRSRDSMASPTRNNPRRAKIASRPSSANGHYSRDSADINLSPDAAHYQARIARQEMLQDASMRKMNAKLKDMIREGQAALGTKVEIEDGMESSGSGYFSSRWR